jgi:beta-lactamase superfamily II metal-dependent hydrolase
VSTYTFTQSIDTGPSWGNLTREVFYNYYPSFDDENNLSLILSLHCNNMHVMFTGDLEKAGWLELLKNERFKNELRTINVFVASHHGRENGCCEEVFKYCKPEVVIISDGPHQYETQKTVGWYSQRASGIRFDGKPRRVFSTRSDGYILIESTPEHTILDTQKRRDKVKAF